VNIAFDGHRIAGRAVEVGREAAHQEPGVEAHQHEPPAGPREPRRLAVGRREIGHVLVGQQLGDEVEAARRQARGGGVT
jgi:hypothetical protein